MRCRSILILVFLGISMVVFSQDKDRQKEARSLVREGNEQYNHLKFSDAEIAYKKAIEKNPNYTKAIYNLGNTLYQENRLQEAVSEYQKVAKTTKDKMLKSSVFHNLGNTMMKAKKYAEAVEAYKESLRNNPKDEETRYNLALAQKMLKKQQNKNKNKKKDDKKKDKKKDKKDQNKKDDKNKKDKDKKDDKSKTKIKTTKIIRKTRIKKIKSNRKNSLINCLNSR